MYIMCSFSSDESGQTPPKHRTCNSRSYILPQRGRSPWKVENNYSARNKEKQVIGSKRGFPPKWVFVSTAVGSLRLSCVAAYWPVWNVRRMGCGGGAEKSFLCHISWWFCSKYRISMHLPDSSHPRSPFQDPAIQRLLTVLAETIDEKSSYDMRQVVRYADTRKTGKKNQKEINKTRGRHKKREAVWNIIITLKMAVSQKLGNERRVAVAQSSGNQT